MFYEIILATLMFTPFNINLLFAFSYSEEKCKKSQKFAAEAGLPILANVLLPKTKGFSFCLEALRGSLDAGSFTKLYSCLPFCEISLLSRKAFPLALFVN